jgi:hypothetical protein
MSDHELEKRIADREYQLKSNKEFLGKELPLSLRNDLSLENSGIKKDLRDLYHERSSRGKNPSASMLSQCTLEVEVEGEICR